MGAGFAGSVDGGARKELLDMMLPKPFKTHRDEPALKPLLEAAPPGTKAIAYEQLVTRQNVSPEKARELLGIPQPQK